MEIVTAEVEPRWLLDKVVADGWNDVVTLEELFTSCLFQVEFQVRFMSKEKVTHTVSCLLLTNAFCPQEYDSSAIDELKCYVVKGAILLPLHYSSDLYEMAW